MKNIFKELFIFEMANNHQGSVKHGLKIINAMGKIARKYQIHAAVKFQYRDLDTLIHPNYFHRTDVKHIPRFVSTRLSDSDFRTMLDAVREQDMVTIVTPFDEASVGKCLDHGVQILKVASCSANDWPLLETIADSHKPVIISTGGIPLREIDNIVSFFEHRQQEIALLHCIGLYPAENANLNLSFIDKLIRRYRYLPVGYSGHEAPGNLDVVKIAVSKGATILERHVGIATAESKLNAYSSSPEQADAWVAAAIEANIICGQQENKTITQEELDSLMSLQRGVYAAKPVKKGNVIRRKDVFFAMPRQLDQLSSGQFGQYRATYIASKDYEENEAISETRLIDEVSEMRSIIHEAKGMLYEAKIELGTDFEIELSHHFGIQHFRQTGAIIVSLVNREYCKKLIVLLPGQMNPTHYHRKKEETFQLLWGELEVILEGKSCTLLPGDKLLVERDAPHSFRTGKGAIIEEISSTHYRDDSFYEDEEISKLDPMERKTILTQF